MFKLSRLLVGLVLCLSLAILAHAAVTKKAILLVWDSSSPAVTSRHQEMVQHLKSLRAEGHYTGVPGLDPKIKVYDFHVTEHASSLSAIGLKRAADCPYLALVALDSQGIPSKVLWGVRYTAPDQATLKLDASLGLAGRNGETVGLVVVTDASNSGLASLTQTLLQRVQEGQGELGSSNRLTRKPVFLRFDRPEARPMLAGLGLDQTQAPYLLIARFQGETAREALWSSAVKDVPASWHQLLAYLQDTRSTADEQAALIVGDPAQYPTLCNALEAKLLRAIDRHQLPGLAMSVVKANNLAPMGIDSHAGPVLALTRLDASGKPSKIVWSRPVGRDEDEALTALAAQVGGSYSAPEEMIWPKDGTVLRLVRGGEFSMGSAAHTAEGPPHPVRVQTFYLSKLELTNEQFSRFVSATGYRSQAERDGYSYVFRGGTFAKVDGASWRHPTGPGSSAPPRLPVVQMSFNDALAYGRWAGLRVPTESEWEYAARGPENRLYPWGDQFSIDRLRSSVGGKLGSAGGPSVVGSFASGASPFGLLDMAGNVYEWVDSPYTPYPGNQDTSVKFNSDYLVLRGGSWGNQEPADFEATRRTPAAPGNRNGAVGIRLGL